LIWTWYFAWTLTLVISIISETLTKFPSIMTELWRHKTEKWRVFSCFGRNSSLTCSTTSIFMNISQNACFIKTKHFAKFRTVTDRNDGVMTSSKFRRDVKKMMTSYLRQKWRNRLQTFQTVISCHSDRFCKVSMIFDIRILSSENTPFHRTANTDDVIDDSHGQSKQDMMLKFIGWKSQHPILTTSKISLLYHVWKYDFEPSKK